MFQEPLTLLCMPKLFSVGNILFQGNEAHGVRLLRLSKQHSISLGNVLGGIYKEFDVKIC